MLVPWSLSLVGATSRMTCLFLAGQCCLLLFVFGAVLSETDSGDPCVEGTHTCDLTTQRCVEGDNSTDNFTCQCLRADQQLDDDFNCTDIPDNQILYLTTPINTTGADIVLVFQVLGDPSYSEQALREMYLPLKGLPSFKDVKFLEYRVGTVPDFRIAAYALLFTENVTSLIRHAVALAVLYVEEVGYARTNNVTVTFAGHTGIFDTEEDSRTDQDAIDWCSSPLLHSCRANSTCRDVNLRYDCPCLAGFEDDGTSCFVCDDDFRYGPDCAFSCMCVFDNTVSCDRKNGTCLCREQWAGARCDVDVDECDARADLCGDPAFYRCVNAEEGYQCECADGTTEDADTGECRGVTIKGFSPFDTDGTRELHLVCDVSIPSEVTQYEWSDACLQTEAASCTVRPQPPWDDGKTINCTAHFSKSPSLTASFVLVLNYPPPSVPLIEGYTNGEKRPAGDNLIMTCTVIGGKPLASSVLFSCPRHPDVSPDVTSASGVTSVLSVRLTSADDGALCTCSARWKRGLWYAHSSTRVLRVVENAGTGGEALDVKWYAIFGSLGVLFLFLIVLTVLICRRRGQNRYSDSTRPSTEQTSAGSKTTGMGSNQPRIGEELFTLDSHTGPENVLHPNWGPAPQQHVWRRYHHWPSPPIGGSAEDLSSWGQERLRVRAAEGRQRHSRRRNSLGGESGVYDQIGAAAADFFASGLSSDMYLHPPGVAPHHPSSHGNHPHPAPNHLYSRYHQRTAAALPPPPPHSQATTTTTTTTRATGPRQERFLEPAGAGRTHAQFWW